MKRFLALLGLASASVSVYGSQIQKMPAQSQPQAQQLAAPVQNPALNNPQPDLKKGWLRELLSFGIFKQEVEKGAIKKSLDDAISLASADKKLEEAAILTPALADALLKGYSPQKGEFSPATVTLDFMAKKVLDRIIKKRDRKDKLFAPDPIIKQAAQFVSYLQKIKGYTEYKDILIKAIPKMIFEQGYWGTTSFKEEINPKDDTLFPIMATLKAIKADDYFKSTWSQMNISVGSSGKHLRAVPVSSLLPYLNEDFSKSLSLGVIDSLKKGQYNAAWNLLKLFSQVLATGSYSPDMVNGAIEQYVNTLSKGPTFLTKEWRKEAWESFQKSLPDLKTKNGWRRFQMSSCQYLFLGLQVASLAGAFPLSVASLIIQEIVSKSFVLTLEHLNEKEGWESAEDWVNAYKFYPSYSYPYFDKYLDPNSPPNQTRMLQKTPFMLDQELRSRLTPHQDYLSGKRFGVENQSVEELEGKARIVGFLLSLFTNISSGIYDLLQTKGLSDEQQKLLGAAAQELDMYVSLINLLTFTVSQNTLKYNPLFAQVQDPGTELPSEVKDLVEKVKAVSKTLTETDWTSLSNYARGTLLSNKIAQPILMTIINDFRKQIQKFQTTDSYRQECLGYYKGCLDSKGGKTKEACGVEYQTCLTKDLLQKTLVSKFHSNGQDLFNDMEAINSQYETKIRQVASAEDLEPWISAQQKALEEAEQESERKEEIAEIQKEDQTQNNPQSIQQTGPATQQAPQTNQQQTLPKQSDEEKKRIALQQGAMRENVKEGLQEGKEIIRQQEAAAIKQNGETLKHALQPGITVGSH